MTKRSIDGPLSGIRVLDLSRVLAGPWATQLLADYGAEVIKIERPGSGDDTRHWGPPWLGGNGATDQGDSAYFQSANRNKKSITVNLAHPEGQQLVRAIAAHCDVMVENFKRGDLDRYGLGAERLTADNPRLIYCTISAFDRSGSRADEPGYDAMIQASAGLMSITGDEPAKGGQPQKVGVAISDIMAGMYAVTAVLAALHERESSGLGQYLEVPLYESQVAWLANQSSNFLVGGVVPGRMGTAHPNIVPYQLFEAADGYLMLAVGTNRQFADCMDVLGLPDTAKDLRFRSNADRLRHRDELIEVMSERFATDGVDAWLERLRQRKVPAGPVNDIPTVLTNDYAREQELVRSVPHGSGAQVPTVANPVRFSRNAIRYQRAAPNLGEHTEEILRGLLGLDAEEIVRLRDNGAI